MDTLTTPQGRQLIYNKTPGRTPGIVFLGGYMSDRSGSKAVHLESWAQLQGYAYVRFDYSGHGESSGRFEDGAIGDWYEDALAILESCCEGPQILVGSSMGGWIALLIARERVDLVSGLVTIAVAPDFTTMKWDSLSNDQKNAVAQYGHHREPSAYGTDYIFTKRLFEDGMARSVLNHPLCLNMPIRMLQGTEDKAVPTEVALRLLAHIECPDASLELVKSKDHSFSDSECLTRIETKISEVQERIGH